MLHSRWPRPGRRHLGSSPSGPASPSAGSFTPRQAAPLAPPAAVPATPAFPLTGNDVVLADALFDDYFIAWELRQRGVELVARAQYQRVDTQTVRSRPDSDLIVWQRPNKPHGMKGEQYRTYPKALLMRQVSVDARGKDNRVEQFKVITTILDAAIDGGQIGALYERRWDGEVDIRSIKSTMKMDVLRCKTPEMV